MPRRPGRVGVLDRVKPAGRAASTRLERRAGMGRRNLDARHRACNAPASSLFGDDPVPEGQLLRSYQYESDTPTVGSYIHQQSSSDGLNGGVWRSASRPTLGGLVLRADERLRLPRFPSGCRYPAVRASRTFSE